MEETKFILQKLFKNYKYNEIGFAFNGGKDSCVVLELLHRFHSKSLNNISIVHFKEEHEFPEITTFVKYIQKKYNFKMIFISGPVQIGLHEFCKVNPHIKAFVTGCRSIDPHAHQTPFSPTTLGWPPLIRVSPILHWKYKDVWEFLRNPSQPVEYPSIYNNGYTSFGNMLNSRPNPILKRPDNTFEPAWKLTDDSLERLSRI